jgi:hypothetical protein
MMDRKDQILAVHANFINQVVITGQQPERKDDFEQLLKLAADNGWSTLTQRIRQIFQHGRRDMELLNGLDEEDQVIAKAILRGLQDPSTLPNPNAQPDPAAAAPSLASMIHAAGSGHAQALQTIAEIAGQMSRAGGPMAQLAAVIRPLINGERDPDTLCKKMDSRTELIVLGILDELKRLQQES